MKCVVRRKERAHQLYRRRVFTTCVYWPSLKRYLLHKAQAFFFARVQSHMISGCWKTWTAKRKIHNRQRKTLKVGFLLHVIAVKSIAAFLINLYVIFYCSRTRFVVGRRRVSNWDVVCWWICFASKRRCMSIDEPFHFN